jgi:transcriptional regulator with XRE-family HTH domain
MARYKFHPRHADLAVAFGKTLKVARQRRQIKQDTLAYEVGVLTDSVSRWENGHAMPTLATVLLICAVLDIPTSQFFAAMEKALHLSDIKAAGGKITLQKDHTHDA